MVMGFVRSRGGPKLGRSDGQAMVEFVLIVPILLTVVLAGIQFGLAFLQYQELSNAVSEGARKAIVSRTSATRTTAVTNAVHNAAPGLTAGNMPVTISTSPSGWTYPGDVTVTATYPLNINILGITVVHSTLSSTRTMRLEQ
jgi:Flp pilus assembly protein TadG